MSRLIKVFSIFIITCIFSVLFLGTADSAHAVTAGDWKPGRIIDDSIFYNNASMSVGDIQSFLNDKVPVCDTGGTKPYNANMTRAQYSISQGYPPPYVCLKDYVENPSTHANNLAGGSVAGGWSAAQIIKHASDSYVVNPKALIVLLQKEQTLVTDDWPWPNQYRSATGYGCPDTAACDSQYYGFFNQVMNAARQFRLYANNTSQYRYKPGQTNYIQYNPNVNCGGTNVYIENAATAGLYNYTPYQPNASALNNLYGSGDGCGAYGNRNFWRLFNDWFGSTIGDCQPGEPIMAQVQRIYNPSTYEHFYSAYQCEINVLTQKHGFKIVGSAYNTTLSSSTSVPVYRLYNPSVKVHFWTTSTTESNALQQQGYQFEGTAFHVASPNSPNIYPVYREYNPNTGVHFWTLSLTEADNANRNAGYRFEGTAFYSQ